jgi:hypothetical protein
MALEGETIFVSQDLALNVRRLVSAAVTAAGGRVVEAPRANCICVVDFELVRGVVVMWYCAVKKSARTAASTTR